MSVHVAITGPQLLLFALLEIVFLACCCLFARVPDPIAPQPPYTQDELAALDAPAPARVNTLCALLLPPDAEPEPEMAPTLPALCVAHCVPAPATVRSEPIPLVWVDDVAGTIATLAVIDPLPMLPGDPRVN